MKRTEIIEKIISFMSEEFEVEPEVIKPEAEPDEDP
jgi:acyl carrier protein